MRVAQRKVRSHIPYLDGGFGHGVLFLLRSQPVQEGESAENDHPEYRDQKSSSHSISPPWMFCRVSRPMSWPRARSYQRMRLFAGQEDRKSTRLNSSHGYIS